MTTAAASVTLLLPADSHVSSSARIAYRTLLDNDRLLKVWLAPLSETDYSNLTSKQTTHRAQDFVKGRHISTQDPSSTLFFSYAQAIQNLRKLELKRTVTVDDA